MSIRHYAVTLDGRELGLAVTLGRRFKFFTTVDALAEMDGEIYGSLGEIQARARELLAPVAWTAPVNVKAPVEQARMTA